MILPEPQRTHWANDLKAEVHRRRDERTRSLEVFLASVRDLEDQVVESWVFGLAARAVDRSERPRIEFELFRVVVFLVRKHGLEQGSGDCARRLPRPPSAPRGSSRSAIESPSDVAGAAWPCSGAQREGPNREGPCRGVHGEGPQLFDSRGPDRRPVERRFIAWTGGRQLRCEHR